MSVQITFLIRKGTRVWVGKDLTSSSLKLFRHTMKLDLAIPHPTADGDAGPKVIGLSRDVANIREPKRMMLKMFVLSGTPGPQDQASLLELLELGFDVFVTDHETYPLMVVYSDHVDEVDETDWDVEDMGDNLKVYRKATRDMYFKKKIQDIKDHPERHRHDFAQLQNCCFHDGAIDMALLEAHSKYVDLGTNGGQRCDVASGPCACGAWHMVGPPT